MNKLIVANWKMNPLSTKEAEALFAVATRKIGDLKKTKLIICPPFPFLYVFKKNKISKISLGAQNVHKEISGSYTGEVSSSMLLDLGVSYVIVGHGERRAQGETDESVNEKLFNLLKFKLSPIVCIGEKERDREGQYLSLIESQITSCLKGVPKSQMKNVIIAYEPIWAIGKNAPREATVEEFMEMKIFIKKVISDIYDSKTAHSIPILYGGSINSLNAKSFLDGGADGLIIGRDSISPNKFDAVLSAIN